jgi:hypothetical protein
MVNGARGWFGESAVSPVETAPVFEAEPAATLKMEEVIALAKTKKLSFANSH